jgi:hypothetical protein
MTFLFLLFLVISIPAKTQAAEDQETKTEESKILGNWSAATSDQDYRGKRLQYPVQIIATVADAPPTRNKVCIPAHTRLRGLSQLQSSGLLVLLRGPRDTKDRKPIFQDCASIKLPGTAQPPALQAAYMPLDEAYGRILIIPKDTTQGLPIDMSGLSYGLLFVPFKYHLTGSKSFKGAASIGPYAGWKTESSDSASSIEFAGFIGLSSVANEQVIEGKTVKNDLAALSYGVAVIGRIRENFQVGLVIGADRVGKDAQYRDNGKPWLAVSIGYAFSR